eukprot:TRINITY_DN6038_c0_g1_i1.p1 TRINITY_DN6038_c0_g1~~TRINITY_DN6038_c0_g1_i1.p1  ORF type:complete len:1954 (+),score=468.69 TRINITY_DN6038_c0_g1_i1:60-5921(+)
MVKANPATKTKKAAAKPSPKTHNTSAEAKASTEAKVEQTRKRENKTMESVPVAKKPRTSGAGDEDDFPRGERPRSMKSAKKATAVKDERSGILKESLFAAPSAKKMKKAQLTQSRLKAKSAKSNAKKIERVSAKSANHPRVENLSRKNISINTTMLAVINHVSPLKVTVSLPHGIPASLNLVDISDEISALIDQTAVDSPEQNEVPDLVEIFTVGQVIICSFIDSKKIKDSTRFYVTTKPSVVNKGLLFEHIDTGLVLTGSIKSKEDHGYVINIGVEGCTAFLNKKHIPEGANLHLGQVLCFGVLSCHKTRKVVSLTLDEKYIEDIRTIVTKDTSLEQLKPGVLVDATFKEATKSGALMSLGGVFDASVYAYHHPEPLSKDYGSYFNAQKTVSARILFVDPVSKALGLTMNPDLLNFKAPQVDNWGLAQHAVVDNAELVKQDKFKGWYINLGNGKLGFAPSKYTPDEKEAKTLKIVAGHKCKCRIMSYSRVDNMAIVNLKTAIVECEVLGYQDLQVGQVVQGKISSVGDTSLEVKLSETVKAICPMMHVSDGAVRNLANFAVGQSYTFKVLSLNVEKSKCVVTRKPTLVKSTQPIISDFSEAVAGTVSLGVITSVQDHGCFVSFFGQVSGFVPKSNLAVSGDIKDSFFEGQVVKALVVQKNDKKKRITLSLNLDDPIMTTSNKGPNLVIGTIYDAVVAEFKGEAKTDGIQINIGSISAFVPVYHLSDHPENWSLMKKIYTPGKPVKALCYGLQSKTKEPLITLKPALLQASLEHTIPSNVADVVIGNVYAGFVNSVAPIGVFVQFLGKVSGLVMKKNLQDAFVSDPSLYYKQGQTVFAKVIEVKEAKQLILSTRPSDCGLSVSEDNLLKFLNERDLVASVDPEVTALINEPIGSITPATVSSVSGDKVILKLAKGASAVCSQYHVQDTPKQGASVNVAILDVDAAAVSVDVSMRSDLLSLLEAPKATKKSSKKKQDTASASSLIVGKSYEALVQLIKPNYVIALVASNRALVTVVPAPTGYLLPLTSIYHAGQTINVSIQSLSFGHSQRTIAIPQDISFEKQTKATETPAFKMELGSIVSGYVIAKSAKVYIVTFGKHYFGHLPVHNIADFVHGSVPKKSIELKSNLKVKIVQVLNEEPQSADNHKMLSEREPNCILSARPSELEAPGKVLYPPCTIEQLSEGDKVECVVAAINQFRLDVVISGGVNGAIQSLDLRDAKSDPVSASSAGYQVGQTLSAYVRRINYAKKLAYLSIHEQARDDCLEGSITHCQIVKKLSSFHMLVALPDGNLGQVCCTDVADEYKPDIFKALKIGHFAKCYIINVSGSDKIEVSTRASRVHEEYDKVVDPEVVSVKNLSIHQVLRGFVATTKDNAVRILIGRNLYAQVHDPYFIGQNAQKLAKNFPVGMLLRTVVTRVMPETNKVNVNLAEKSMDSKLHSGPTIDQFKIGTKVSCRVKKILDCGLILEIENTRYSGLCHASQVSDDKRADFKKLYSETDLVKAVVLKVKADERKISFSMKQSVLDASGDSDEDEDNSVDHEDAKEEEDEDETMVRDVTEFDPDTAMGPKPSADDVDEDDEEEESDESENEDMEDEDDEDEDGADDDDVEDEEDQDDAPAPSSFGWDDLKFSNPTKAVKAGSDSESEDDEDEETLAAKESKSKKQKLKEKRQEEEKIKRMEEALLDDERPPQSAADFERLILSNPNSSFIWVQYMAFQVSITEIEKAREVAERAMKTISFKDENEKLNVWTAYLNLEKSYGTEESLMKIFQRALTHNDPKKVYLRMVDILDHAKDLRLAEQIFKTLISKYKQSKKVWIRYGQFKLNHKLVEDFRKVLERALQVLPKRKHIPTIIKFAIMEFKGGSSERGRAIFNSVLGNYPKRVDLWSVFLDMEVKAGNQDLTRSLFERVTSLNLSSKKMKFFFKRYLEWEKEIGNDACIEHVKEKARKYVESKMK